MTRRLVIALFLIAVSSNALAAVTPHLDGDGGCSAACCQAARQAGKQAAVSRLCCLMDCNQPGGTHASSPAPFCFAKHEGAPPVFVFAAVLAPVATSVELQDLSTKPANDLYLKCGTLLI